MTQQTAVEWLVEQCKMLCLDEFKTIFKKEIEQAKQMEKEQIMDSYIMGSYEMARKEFNPEKYYNEIYNK